MSTSTRLNRAFLHAPLLPLSQRSRYILMSDCHRGIGTSSDNFLKNQHLYFAAMEHYYRQGFTYIELGDGDELWENRRIQNIMDIHSDVFRIFEQFHRQNRLYLLYGNHDIVKRKKRLQPLFSPLCFYEGIILTTGTPPDHTPRISLYLTHGHQASLLNSTLWPLSRFLVRYVWNPLENLGVLDPTSAAKNYHTKNKCESRLNRWAEENRRILIAGHTHRPTLPDNPAHYYNTGSCVHPRCITCIEIERMTMTLVKWSMATRTDSTLYVAREIISGPVSLYDSETVRKANPLSSHTPIQSAP
ncbi:MAG: serine/threonine protein phosphatase [Lachnospiraceae bacterium]|nr:serine/threonine protein phosphatase [Lachnospiraceae bacterium]